MHACEAFRCRTQQRQWLTKHIAITASKLACCRSGMNASTSSLDWSEGERNSMRFLNHLLCRPLREMWTEDPPELRARGGASRWRPTIRSKFESQTAGQACHTAVYAMCPILYASLVVAGHLHVLYCLNTWFWL